MAADPDYRASASIPTVAVRLTASGTGAIAVVLLAGDIARLHMVLRMHLGAAPESVQTGRFARVNVHAADGRLLDDALLVGVAGGRWELQVHGGVAVVEGVLGALAAAGVRVVDALEAQRMGLLGEGVAGELMLALPGAVTETGLRVLLGQERALGAWAEGWQRALERGVDLWQLQAAAQWLLMRSRALSRLLAGNEARVAIVGPPNAGKSTLANALLGRPVSITSDLAGTTRDWVDAHAVLVAGGEGGVQVPVVLVDTAGVRATPDELERESIQRTHRQAAGADVVVVLLDGTRPLTEEERVLLRTYVRAVVVVNKMDVAGATMAAELAAAGAVGVSARSHAGLDVLMRRVLERLDLQAVGAGGWGEAFAFNERLRGLVGELAVCDRLDRCKALLAAMCAGGVGTLEMGSNGL